jgi:hypothetical protein
VANSDESEYRAGVLAGVSTVTIFDTNAYRGLVRRYPASARDRAGKLVHAERSVGVRAFATSWVVVELASHLADVNDPDYTECAAALAALWVHCRADDGGRDRLPTVPDAEALLCMSLYGEVTPGHEPATDLLIEVARQIHDDPSPAAMVRLLPTLQRIKAYADEFETRWVSFMQHSLDGYDLSDQAVRRAIGRELAKPAALKIAGVQSVLRARQLLGLAGDDPELADRAHAVCDNFKTATRLFLYKMQQMANRVDISAPRHRNSVWDIDISYMVGQTVHRGVPLHLVTSDKDIRRSARKAGETQHVSSLDGYLDRMGMRGRGPRKGLSSTPSSQEVTQQATADWFRDPVPDEAETRCEANKSLAAADHEAIHAVLHVALGLDFVRVRIDPGDHVSGRVWTQRPDEDRRAHEARIYDRDVPEGVGLLRSQLRWLIATVGPWACKGLSWGCAVDKDVEFEQDKQVAWRHAERLLGMDDHGNSVVRPQPPIAREKYLIKRAESLARRIAWRRALAVDRVAVALDKRGQLTAPEVRRICNP